VERAVSEARLREESRWRSALPWLGSRSWPTTREGGREQRGCRICQWIG
jgi:hypothetical protein